MAKLHSSADNIFTATAGLLAPSDFVELAGDVAVVGSALTDDANGARHQLQPVAQYAIAQLALPKSAETWMRHLQADGVTPQQSAEIITFLARIGALRITRTPSATLKHAIQTLYAKTLGFKAQALARRWPATPAGIMWACTYALLPLLVALPIVGLLWSGTGLPTPHIWVLIASAMTTLWISVVVHEAAHCLPITRHQPHPAIIQSGLHLGIIHRPLPPRTDLVSALAGPLAGAIVAILIAPGYIGALIAIFHLASLLPFSSDGRMVWRSRGVRA